MKAETNNWIIKQVWRDILFLNYPVPPELISPTLPKGLELDTYNGLAYLSIVPFRMEGIQFRYGSPVPFSNLWELNLRTYVSYKGRKGIYFYTLDTDHLLGSWIAKTFFNLPYRFKSIRGFKIDSIFQMEGENLLIEAKLSSVPILNTLYQDWLTERYCLFTTKSDSIIRGDVFHKPWPLKFCKVKKVESNLIKEFFPGKNPKLESAFFCDELPVSFEAFKRNI